MSWGFVAGGAVSLIGGALSSKGSSDASKRQQQGVEKGIASEERMFNKSLELQAPYRDAGYASLEGLNELNDPTGRADLLKSYYEGDEYTAMSAQAEEQAIRNGLATGKGRGGGTKAALATIAPQMGQNYLSDRYNRLTGVANMGIGAASQGANAATNFGASSNFAYNQSAQAGAANDLAQANIWGNVVKDIGGFGMDYLNKKG